MNTERWKVLDHDECRRLLALHPLGRIAYVHGDGPVILPINYVVDGDFLIIRTGDGTLAEVAARGASVAFEIDGIDTPTRSGWSVLVTGQAEQISDRAELARLADLPLLTWAPGHRPTFVRIRPLQVTGRWVSAADLPSRWWG